MAIPEGNPAQSEEDWARLGLTLDPQRRASLSTVARGRQTHDVVLANALLAEAIDAAHADALLEQGQFESRVNRAAREERDGAVGALVRGRSERGSIEVEPAVYGCSRGGRELEVWMPPGPPARLLVVAGVHGEEPETTVLLSSAMRALRPGALAAAVVVAANPDGLARGTRGNAAGVDLNRNFPGPEWSPRPVLHHWTRSDPRDVRLSSGSQPASEPETTAIMALVERLAPEAVVALHAPLAQVIDNDDSPLGRRLARELRLPLTVSYPAPIPGSFDAWLRSRGIVSATVELPVLSKDALLTEYLTPLIRLLGERTAPSEFGETVQDLSSAGLGERSHSTSDAGVSS